MRYFLVTMLAFAGCVTSARWDDAPTAQVHAEAPVAYLADWQVKIDFAIDAWIAVLPATCSTPFMRVESSPHPIRLVEPVDWNWGTDAGVINDDVIEIRADTAIRPNLIHELGHAIGLEHTDPGDGPSIMWSGYGSPLPTESDGALAACSLRCGPC